MVSFAELKAKAEKAKDASVAAMVNTRDRYSSMPSSKVNWDHNWKRPPPTAPSASSTGAGRASVSSPPPPPPSRSRPEVGAAGVTAPAVPRRSHLIHEDPDAAAYVPPPPPTRVASGYPPRTPNRDVTSIDWAHLSAEDKEAFFAWLDEFFSQHLGMEVGPNRRRAIPLKSSVLEESVRAPSVNLATRPQA